MPPIEFDGARAVQPVRKLAPASARPGSAGVHGESAISGKQASRQPETVQLDAVAFEAGQPTMDIERVAQIRKAVESGSYPLLPARVADAMIAAGMFLRKGA